jgi:hypothetical protein
LGWLCGLRGRSGSGTGLRLRADKPDGANDYKKDYYTDNDILGIPASLPAAANFGSSMTSLRHDLLSWDKKFEA